MGSEKTADWYDEYYRQHPDPSPELTAIHDMVADLVIAHGVSLVSDVGCGPGWFVDRLATQGYRGEYLGVDFSRVAVERANHAVRRTEAVGVFGGAWVGSLGSTRTQLDLGVVVAVEVLEHLADDVVTFDRIVPAGRRVVISVPTYDSESHVRWFAETDDVKGRYGVRGVQFVKDRQIYVSGVKVAR